MEWTTGQNSLSMELSCVLEQDTHISTCNQTETVVELNPYCVLEQDTCISTCNHTETVVELNPYCVLEQDTHISTCNQMEMVVEWNPYGRISHNMSSVPTHVTKYWLHSPDLYHDKTTSYNQDMLFIYEYHVWCHMK